MDEDAVAAWLASYGTAWENRDSTAFIRLFSPDVHYYWTPFEEPKRGRDRLAEAFQSATAGQERIAFRASLLAVRDSRAVAHWQCSFQRVGTGLPVHLDGIFLMEFDAQAVCTVFREWWHAQEAAAADPEGVRRARSSDS